MISIIEVDFKNPQHANNLVRLMDEYARDPMGGGKPLGDDVKESLPKKLEQLDHGIHLLAMKDDEAVGLLNAFQGFSTFAARPLINIHDVIVSSKWRGQGISQKMIQHLEAIAIERDCCKLTLEVLSENAPARASYAKVGFDAYRLHRDTGIAEFWQKPLNSQVNQ